MGADNWDSCPRCFEEATEALRTRRAKIDASYGKVSVEEFDQAREQWEADRAAHQNFPLHWREDIRVEGACTGTVVITYKGNCSKCKLKLEFEVQRHVPGFEPA